MSANITSSIAPKGLNSQLAGTFIPSYSSVSLGLPYPGSIASNFPNFSNAYGSTEWRNGIDIGATANGSSNENVFYAIYSDQVSQGLSPSTNVAVGWGITGGNEVDILATINRLPGMHSLPKHASYTDAITWLIQEGKYLPVNRDYPQISYNTETPIVMAYDPSFMASYPFVGDKIYELTGYGSYASLIGGAQWDSTNKNAIIINTPGSDYITLPSNCVSGLNSAIGMTISIWFYVNSLPTPGSTATLIDFKNTGSGSIIPNDINVWSKIYIDENGDILYVGDPQTSGSTPASAVILRSLSGSVGSWCNLVVSVPQDGNIGSCLNGGSVGYVSYGFATTGQFSTAGSSASSIGISMDGGFSPISGTALNGKIGAIHIYRGILSSDQMKDIESKTLSIY
jgi:hypothetical protein